MNSDLRQITRPLSNINSAEQRLFQPSILSGRYVCSENTESVEDPDGLDRFVQESKIKDRAIEGRETTLVKIWDPCNGKLLASIRDPGMSIKPYTTKDGLVNMQEHIDNSKQPIFFKAEPPLRYGD